MRGASTSGSESSSPNRSKYNWVLLTVLFLLRAIGAFLPCRRETRTARIPSYKGDGGSSALRLSETCGGCGAYIASVGELAWASRPLADLPGQLPFHAPTRTPRCRSSEPFAFPQQLSEHRSTVLCVDFAAILISVFSLAIAACSLGWQVAVWTLSGRRVRLRLLHGVAGRGGFAVGAVDRSETTLDLTSMRRQGWDGPEVIGVEVVNVGRAPVSVRGYSVQAIGGGMSLRPVGDIVGPALPFRLEPGESETWYSDARDARALLSSLAAIGRQSRSVRMAVSLGTGQERATRRKLRLV